MLDTPVLFAAFLAEEEAAKLAAKLPDGTPTVSHRVDEVTFLDGAFAQHAGRVIGHELSRQLGEGVAAARADQVAARQKHEAEQLAKARAADRRAEHTRLKDAAAAATQAARTAAAEAEEAEAEAVEARAAAARARAELAAEDEAKAKAAREDAKAADRDEKAGSRKPAEAKEAAEAGA